MDDSTRREFAAILLPGGILARPGKPVPTMLRKDFEPAYLKLERSGELARRARTLWEIYKSCRLCPRQCGVNRLKGEKG
ncbi:MAG: radical SAM protein, partial [Bryobacteraceae bacterium]